MLLAAVSLRKIAGYALALLLVSLFVFHLIPFDHASTPVVKQRDESALLSSWPGAAEQGPEVDAAAAILLENTTGTVLYEKNARQRRPMASTTKIMTALLAIEQGHLDDMVTISTRAAATRGSSAKLKAGDRLRLEDLLYALLLRSGNDAAVAVAEHLARSVPDFAKVMTLRARELGAEDTFFQNPHGIDAPGQYSTAYDLALIARTAMLYPTFARIVSTREYTVTLGEDAEQLWRNTNRLLWMFDGVQGIKTGTTDGAGRCLVAAAARGNRQLISVVLGSKDRYDDTEKLLNYGFNRFDVLIPVRGDETVVRAPVPNGLFKHVDVVAARELAVVVRNEDTASARTRIVLENLKAPLRARQRVGELQLLLDSKVIGRVALETRRTVPRHTWFNVIWHQLSQLWL